MLIPVEQKLTRTQAHARMKKEKEKNKKTYLDKMVTMNSLMKKTLSDCCKMNKMLHQKAIT